jgi:nucleotide-binding universal stress UspA family protein
MARLVSVNVGRPRPVGLHRGRTVQSAIGKAPVAGRVRVAGVNVEGDDQADRSVHGGPDKVVYAYAAEDGLGPGGRPVRQRAGGAATLFTLLGPVSASHTSAAGREQRDLPRRRRRSQGAPIMAGTAVFAYDGSEDAKRAVAVAHDVLAVDRAIIVHVRVIPLPPVIGADPAGDESAPSEGTTPQQADRIASDGVDVATRAGFEAESVVETADSTTGVWKTILDVADERGAAAIVSGHRGLSRFRSAVLGSVSNGLVNHAQLPVLVVPLARR